MEDEITFRTSVGGYRKDEVMEYVENMNDQIFRMKKESGEDAARYQAKIQELESVLKQEEVNSLQISEDSRKKQQDLEEENAQLKEQLRELEAKLEKTREEQAESQKEKEILKEKLAREILRLRSENKKLTEKWQEAERNVGSRADYEAVRSVVSEVQYKIAEYVNVINKTQQSLADTYQSMNGIKKKISAQMEKEENQKK